MSRGCLQVPNEAEEGCAFYEKGDIANNIETGEEVIVEDDCRVCLMDCREDFCNGI